jgi:hypothetical protein
MRIRWLVFCSDTGTVNTIQTEKETRTFKRLNPFRELIIVRITKNPEELILAE